MRVDVSLTRRLAKFTLIFLHAALLPGIYITIQTGRPRFLALSLILVLSIVIVDVFLFMRVGASRTERDDIQMVLPSALLDRQIAIVLLFVSITTILLISNVAFYITIALYFTVLLARAQYADYTVESVKIDLVLVTVGSLLLLSTQTLGVPYYVGSPDTINHTSTIVKLVHTGQLSSFETNPRAMRYAMYPIYHILSAIGVLLTKIDARLFVALELGILFQVVITAVFLLIRNVTGSKSLALTSAIFVGFNVSFLSFGMRSHYQALSFVFACIFVYLLFKGFQTYREMALGIIILSAWNMTHHISILMLFVLITPAVGMWFLLTRHRGLWAAPLRVYSILIITFLTYWAIITVRLGELIGWMISSSADNVPSTAYLVILYDSLDALLYASWPFFVDNLHYALGLGITIVGLWALMTTDRIENRNWMIIAAGGLPAIIFYYPNPVWVPLEGLAELDRWQLMTIPFLTVFTALGLRYLTADIDPALRIHGRSVLVWSIVFLLVFVTLSTGMTNPGLTDFTGADKHYRQYLSNQELDAAEFGMSYSGTQPVYSHSEVPTYIRQYSWAEDKSVRYSENQRVEASLNEDRIMIYPGLTIFSIEAFMTQGVKARLVDLYVAEAYRDAQGVEVTDTAQPDRFRWDTNEGSTIYTTGGTVIKYKPSSIEATTT